MIKKKLITTFALGLCLVAFYKGGVASAQEIGRAEIQPTDATGEEVVMDDIMIDVGASEEISFGETTVSYANPGYSDELYSRQKDVEAYVFGEGADRLAQLGSKVSTVGLIGDVIEIGITPYSEEAANLLYEKFGEEAVKVVELEAVLYTTAPDEPSMGGGSDGYVGEGVVLEDGQFGITSVAGEGLDMPVSSDEDYVGKDMVLEDGQMGITAISEPAVDSSYDPKIAESGIVTTSEKEEKSSSLWIGLGIGAGAVVLGGIAFFARKMKLK